MNPLHAMGAARLAGSIGLQPQSTEKLIPIRVLIVDDHILIRDAVAEVVGMDAAFDVSVAESLEEALNVLARGELYDITLLDMVMPDMEGIKSVQKVIDLANAGKVVLFSGNASKDCVMQAISAGAAGFIPKNSRISTMQNALKIVASGELYLPVSILGVASARGSAVVTADEKSRPLTDKEREVLTLVGTGLPNKEIAWRMDSTEVRIKMHMRAICKKLGVANRTGAAIRAREMGLL